MKSHNDEATQRILLLLKIDANNLYQRVSSRKKEYLEIFSLRRTRDHFPMIFNNRYQDTTIMDLAHCSADLITTLDQYYTLVEETSWYLFKTQDMPNTVENYIDQKIRKMENVLATLNLFIDAELGVDSALALKELQSSPAGEFVDPLSGNFSEDLNDGTSQEP
jgi:hypothetical protein